MRNIKFAIYYEFWVMEKMIKSQDAIFVMLSELEQIEICKRKIAKTDKVR